MKVSEYREKHPNCEYCNHRIGGFDRCRATNKVMSRITAKHCPCYVPEPWNYNTDKKGGVVDE